MDDWGRRKDLWGLPDENADPLLEDARTLVRALQQDGAPVDDDGKLVFASAPPVLHVERFDRLDEPRVLLQHLERINEGVLKDPAAAIGAAKELVESTLKFILRDYGVEFDERSASLTDLYKLVAEELRLTRESVPESAKGSRASHRVLQNLATAVQSLAELRNELGVGHGRTSPSPALARHARGSRRTRHERSWSSYSKPGTRGEKQTLARHRAEPGRPSPGAASKPWLPDVASAACWLSRRQRNRR